MQYQLLAIDLDGTLLNTDGRISPRNRAALHRAHEAGLRIVLCTGRSFTETRPIIQQIGLDLDASITVGGAIVTDLVRNRTIERATIPRPLAHEVVDWLKDLGYPVLWLLDADEAGFDGYVIDGPRRHAAVDRWLSMAPVRMRPARLAPDDGRLPVRLTIVDETAALHEVSLRFADTFGTRMAHNVIAVRGYGFTVIESFEGRVNKWYGITRVCERYEIDPARTVAIGDDVNDLPMITAAGLGAAVANAVPEVLSAARVHVAANNHDGVAELIENLLSGRQLPSPPAA